MLEPGSAKRSSKMRTQLKRLLDTDRSLGRNKHSTDPEKADFAFYGRDGSGRGVETSFSACDAFALLTGLRLMRHGWPQGFAVAALRRVKPELEKHHARILSQDPAIFLTTSLFDSEPNRVILSLIIRTQCSWPSFPRIKKTVRAQTQPQYAGVRSSWCASLRHKDQARPGRGLNS